MTHQASSAKLRRLSAALDEAENSALSAMNSSDSKPIPSLLVMYKPRFERPSNAHLLYNPAHIEESVEKELTLGLIEAAAQTARQDAQPAYIVSMVTIGRRKLGEWIAQGFFPGSEVPPEFEGQSVILFSASNPAGQVIRRLRQLISPSDTESDGSYQLGQSVQVELGDAPSELAVFWSTYRERVQYRP